MNTVNPMYNNAGSADQKKRRRYTNHPGTNDVFSGMFNKRHGRIKAPKAQELNDQQQDIISNAVSSTDNASDNTNSDLSDYQANDQTHLISQKDTNMNSINENPSQTENSDHQYNKLIKIVSDFEGLVFKSESLIKENNPFKNILESFNNVNQSHSKIEAFGHKKTYQMLQIAYKISMYALEHRLNDFAIEAKVRRVKISEGGNKFLPIVKTLWGEFGSESVKIDGNTYLKWQHNRSCEKYASVFRHLKDENVRANEVAEHIKKYPGGIKAIVEADSAKYGKPRVPTNSNIKSLEQKIIASKSRPIGTFMLSESKVEEHVAYFIGKISADGTASIYEELKVSNGNFLASLKSAAGE